MNLKKNKKGVLKCDRSATLNPISWDILISSDVSVAAITLWDFILNRAFKAASFQLSHSLLGYLPVSHSPPM